MLDKLKINNIGKTIAYTKMNRCNNFTQINLIKFVKDLGCDIGRKLLHNANVATMEGFVDIVNGDTVIHGKNSIVDQGLIGIINLLSGHTVSGTGLPSLSWSGTSPPAYSAYMVIGSDSSYGTTHDMITLKSPIGTAPGTKPNAQSGTNSNPSTGVYQVQWTATWNPGAVIGTLGEVGLYLSIQPVLQAFQASAGYATYMFSRMSSYDGKFIAFTINNTVPLAITWTFKLTYAI